MFRGQLNTFIPSLCSSKLLCFAEMGQRLKGEWSHQSPDMQTHLLGGVCFSKAGTVIVAESTGSFYFYP